MTKPEVNLTPDELEARQLETQIAELEARLADLNARLPAHSIPPALIAQLDEIDDELDLARARLDALRTTRQDDDLA